MADFELSVTICSWNTQSDLRVCLASLLQAKSEANFEVIVVDNNSEDGSPDMVEREFPWVKLFRLSQNLGFTGGHNYALERRCGKHAFLINSDAFVHPGALRTVLAYAEANPDVGIIGPKLENPDGTLQLSCRRFPNPIAALFRNTFIGRLFPKNPYARDYLMEDIDHTKTQAVDWVSGAAFFVRDVVMETVGLFDDAYYMYCEDIDWCFRTWKAGFRVVYLPTAVVTHAIGRSTDKAPNRMIGRHHSSMLRFFRKNMIPQYPWYGRPFALAFVTAGIGARASIFILKNKIDDARRKW